MTTDQHHAHSAAQYLTLAGKEINSLLLSHELTGNQIDQLNSDTSKLLKMIDNLMEIKAKLDRWNP